MPSETIKLTAKFKLKDAPRSQMPFLHLSRNSKLSNHLRFRERRYQFLQAQKGTYKELRKKRPQLPSHYIYTVCQMATSIFKSYRKRGREGEADGKPVFKKEVMMLDDRLFKPDLEKGVIKLSTPKGRLNLKFYPAKYEKFKDWKVGQAWIVKTPKGVFINVVFSKEVEIREPKVSLAWI